MQSLHTWYRYTKRDLKQILRVQYLWYMHFQFLHARLWHPHLPVATESHRKSELNNGWRRWIDKT